MGIMTNVFQENVAKNFKASVCLDKNGVLANVAVSFPSERSFEDFLKGMDALLDKVKATPIEQAEAPAIQAGATTQPPASTSTAKSKIAPNGMTYVYAEEQYNRLKEEAIASGNWWVDKVKGMTKAQKNKAKRPYIDAIYNQMAQLQAQGIFA